jgi:hypothetical protein
VPAPETRGAGARCQGDEPLTFRARREIAEAHDWSGRSGRRGMSTTSRGSSVRTRSDDAGSDRESPTREEPAGRGLPTPTLESVQGSVRAGAIILFQTLELPSRGDSRRRGTWGYREIFTR